MANNIDFWPPELPMQYDPTYLGGLMAALLGDVERGGSAFDKRRKDYMTGYGTGSDIRAAGDVALSSLPLYRPAKMTAQGLMQALPEVRKGGLNVASAAFQRPFTNMPINVEAVSPVLGQRGEEAFKRAMTERLIGESGAYPMSTLGGTKTTQVPGFGGYVNQAGLPESNPMRAFQVPGVMNVNKNDSLLESIANAGAALEQEAMAGVRFLPFTKNTAENASALFIKPPKGKMTKQQFDEMFGALQSDMVVVHDPVRGGAVVVPYGENAGGEFSRAIEQAKKTLGSKVKTQYGISDYEKDRFFMERRPSSYKMDPYGPGKYTRDIPVTQQIPGEAKDIREGLKYVERKMFPESTSGIPGQVQATPIGGVQPWSRGKNFPVSTIGRQVNGRTMYQPMNFTTGEVGKLYPNALQAVEAEQELWDKWQKFMAMQVGR